MKRRRDAAPTPSDFSVPLEMDLDQLMLPELRAEPVRFGVPFAKGELRHDEGLVLEVDDETMPSEVRRAGSHPDGSVRWLLVEALITARRPRPRCRLVPAPEPGAGPGGAGGELDGIRTSETAAGIRLETGGGSIEVSVKNALRIELDGRRFVVRQGCRVPGGVECPGRAESCTVPADRRLSSTVLVTGAYFSEAGDRGLDWELEVTAHAGTGHLFLDHRFINRTHAPHVSADRLWLAIEPEGPTGRDQKGVARSCRRTEASSEAVLTASERDIPPLENVIGLECPWVCWETDQGGLCVAFRDFLPNFPKRLTARSSSLLVELLPEGAPPLTIYRGVAKTHRMCLIPYRSFDAERLSSRARLFQTPPRLLPAPQRFHASRCFGDMFCPPRRDAYPRFEALIKDMLELRPNGIGMMDYGDEPDEGYFHQNRGLGDLVWSNNEYDVVHLLFTEYARTGARRFFEMGEAAALHWMDVDIIHHHPDPMARGGHCTHTAEHRCGDFVTPSHERLLGLLDYHFLTGSERALRLAVGIGENVVRHCTEGRLKDIDSYQMRELGWALYDLVWIYRATGEPRFLSTAESVLAVLRKWKGTYGGFYQERIPIAGIITAFTLIALKEYHLETRDPAARDLFLEELEAFLATNLNREGLINYLDYFARQPHSIVACSWLEPLAYGYDLSSDERYMRLGMRILEYSLSDMGLRTHLGWGSQKVMATSGRYFRLPVVRIVDGKTCGIVLTPMLPFLQRASDLGWLERLDYRF